MVNGSEISVSIVDVSSHGILKDTTSTTIVRENSLGKVIEAIFRPAIRFMMVRICLIPGIKAVIREGEPASGLN